MEIAAAIKQMFKTPTVIQTGRGYRAHNPERVIRPGVVPMASSSIGGGFVACDGSGGSFPVCPSDSAASAG
jgi:hypothetical protein